MAAICSGLVASAPLCGLLAHPPYRTGLPIPLRCVSLRQTRNGCVQRPPDSITAFSVHRTADPARVQSSSRPPDPSNRRARAGTPARKNAAATRPLSPCRRGRPAGTCGPAAGGVPTRQRVCRRDAIHHRHPEDPPTEDAKTAIKLTISSAAPCAGPPEMDAGFCRPHCWKPSQQEQPPKQLPKRSPKDHGIGAPQRPCKPNPRLAV